MTEALERVVIGSVAITTLALAEAGLDITFPQWRVLVVAGGSADGATVSEIAARIGSAVSPASKLVTRLERRGFVIGAKDPVDRRVTRVRVTDAGRELRARVIDRRREYLRRIAGTVSAPPESEHFLERLAEAFAEYA